MDYELQDNLGLLDARKCNDLGSDLKIDAAALRKGCTVCLSSQAAAFLGKKYKSLLKPVEGKVKGVAKAPELTAPAK